MSLRYLEIKTLLETLIKKIKNLFITLYSSLKVLITSKFFPFIKEISRKFLNLIIIYRQKLYAKIKIYIEDEKIKLLLNKINYYFIYAFSEVYKVVLKRKINLIIITAGILILLFWSVCFNIFYSRYSWQGPKIKKITIQSGLSVDNIAKLLEENDAISNSLNFKIAIKILGKENQIYAGTYYIKKGMNNIELSDLLTTPDYITLGGKGKVTFPEGYRIKQMANLLQKDFDFSKEKFIKETENDSLINILGLNGKIKNLEGFLFPDTYIVPIDADEKKIVKILFDNFISQVYYNEEVQKYISENPQKLLNLITLASIVQAETAIPEEYPIIAGVYINRLKKNIKLQADPTIQYVLPDGPRRLLNKDYKIESPYNTYLHFGLPPGPINNPGLDAIKACIKPAEHNYFFFVAKKDKTHKFSQTYEEHLRAIEEIRRN